jgi:hypothetical protein
VNRLNNHAEVNTKHLAQCFVNLRGQGLTPKSLTKLRFDHVKRGFDVGPLVSASRILRGGHCRNSASVNLWLVPSQAGREEKYTVAMKDEKPECTCRDFEFRNAKCKHIFAVEYTIQREQTADGVTITTETVKVTRKTYTQNWPVYNAAQTEEKSRLQALLYELCKAIPEPEQRRGRPRLSLADIIFASTFKIYSTVSGRRFQSDLQEARRRGFLSKMPSYNSVFRYLEAEALTPYLYELIAASAMPLKGVEEDFAIDSSGFSSGQFMRWFDVKYGKVEDRRMIEPHLFRRYT